MGHLGIAADASIGGAGGSMKYDVDMKQLNENSQINGIHDFIDNTNTQIHGNPLNSF
ncbi:MULTISPECIES: hypothetical protein [Vibrio]|uniref:hypothetical protein n=1 Tax=Vibrio TaxID=662 RepID=UPI0012FFE971|nr:MULTISPECIES: hypothetical protein [unclassified Vibrio]